MMSNSMMNIMVKAVLIRLERGEVLEDILNSYGKLTEEERRTIVKEINRRE